jgi:cytochrome c peroxidase
MTKFHFSAVGIITNSAIAFTTTTNDAALLKQARELFQALPNNVATAESPIRSARSQLGRSLFFDPRLTIDGNLSCSSCHQPALYGTDARPTSIGVQQRPHPRNAPTVLNTAALHIIHWRGDRDSLEDQVAKAITSPITSGQQDAQAVVDRLSRIPGYASLFRAGFPEEHDPISAENVAKAISTFERTLATPSAFDRYLAGDVTALSPTARAGLERFITIGCAECHDGIGVGGAKFRKFGVAEDYWKATGSNPIDNGRADVTKAPKDLYVFRVASLRNVAKTPPYFHDGSVATLPDAVKVMARMQLGLTLDDADTRDVVAFLESLTGDLPAHFATAPNLPSGAVVSTK